MPDAAKQGAGRIKPVELSQAERIPVERVQIGVRLEKRMVKVLKAAAEYFDTTLGELLEDIILHSFEGGGANAFTPESLEKVAALKKIYGMDYDVHSNYRWVHPTPDAAPVPEA